MPTLFFGSMSSLGIDQDLRPDPSTLKRHLYRADGSIIPRGSIFDHFRLTYMAPDHGLHCVGSFWHLPEEKHCAIAWRENNLAKEQKVFMPGLLSAIEGLELARSTFPISMPSSIIFRLENLHSSPLVRGMTDD